MEVATGKAEPYRTAGRQSREVASDANDKSDVAELVPARNAQIIYAHNGLAASPPHSAVRLCLTGEPLSSTSAASPPRCAARLCLADAPSSSSEATPRDSRRSLESNSKETLAGKAEPYRTAGRQSRDVSSNDSERHKQTSPLLAFRIFRPPVQASVRTASAPDHRPLHIIAYAIDRKLRINGKIVQASGPWRTAGNWWRSDEWERDEWDVAVTNDLGETLFRIFRDRRSGAWFVEGVYD
jgi:hypothetical protein